MFTSLCPECGISLNVPEEAALQQCACPECGALFIPENNTPDTNKQSTKRYSWKRRYVWGFFYIKTPFIQEC